MLRALVNSTRSYHNSGYLQQLLIPFVQDSPLRDQLSNFISSKRLQLKQLRLLYGTESLGSITVNQALGGMREIKGLVHETSLLDPEEGILFRGYTIDQCKQLLPHFIPEDVFWLLVTGEIPSQSLMNFISQD
jgi:citrate synthase